LNDVELKRILSIDARCGDAYGNGRIGNARTEDRHFGFVGRGQYSVFGSNLGKLTPLSQLTYLNLSGTKVTAQSVAPLRNMPNLRHLYLFDTAAEADGATARSN